MGIRNWAVKKTKPIKQPKKSKRAPLPLILPLILGLVVFLGGCVRYEVGVNFVHQHRGEIVQHIQLAQQLTNLSQAEVQKWFASIESRAKQEKGKTQRVSPREIVVTIPFSNGLELVDKFNHFFNPNPQGTSGIAEGEGLDLVQLNAQMSLQQSNWLLGERDRLSLKVDLRALGVLSHQGNIIISPGSLIDLEFGLNVPWGGRSLAGENALTPEVREGGNQLAWQLQPGQINKIEAVFWVPSPLGIGSVIIALLMVAGFYLKYGRFPGVARAKITASSIF